jgi:hypothetical protein
MPPILGHQALVQNASTETDAIRRFCTIAVMTVRSTVKHIDWLRATEELLNCGAIVCGGRLNLASCHEGRVRLYIAPPFANHRTPLLIIAPPLADHCTLLTDHRALIIAILLIIISQA